MCHDPRSTCCLKCWSCSSHSALSWSSHACTATIDSRDAAGTPAAERPRADARRRSLPPAAARAGAGSWRAPTSPPPRRARPHGGRRAPSNSTTRRRVGSASATKSRVDIGSTLARHEAIVNRSVNDCQPGAVRTGARSALGKRTTPSGREPKPEMPNPQHAILTNLAKYQWYTHFSRTDGADLGVIKQAMRDVRALGGQTGVTVPVNVCLLFGPTLLADMTDDVPNDFQPYPGLPVVRRQGGQGHAGRVAAVDPLRREGPVLGGAVPVPQRGRRPHERGPRDADVHLPQQPRPHRLHRRHRQPGAGAPARPGDRPRRPAGRRRCVLHRAALGPRPQLLRGSVASPIRRTCSAARRPTPSDSTSRSRRRI